jgi:hypothetical protein
VSLGYSTVSPTHPAERRDRGGTSVDWDAVEQLLRESSRKLADAVRSR